MHYLNSTEIQDEINDRNFEETSDDSCGYHSSCKFKIQH
jgi:hypothetical protein